MQEEKKEKKLEDNEDVKKIKELIDNQKTSRMDQRST